MEAGSSAAAVDVGALDDAELASWLRLTGTPGVGPATCRALLTAFGPPEVVLGATPEALTSVVTAVIARALLSAPSPGLEALIVRTQAWAREAGNHVVTLADARYPAALFETTDPPPLLYVKGRIKLLAASNLAIVGSRNATAQGRIDAARFAESLAASGLTIVSGLALGIDAAAHEGALAVGPAGGSTIAVIGTGADIVYPSAHRALAHRIAEEGALISELPLGTTAAAHHFPRRNRIIAGLSRGVLVIEAAARSGSLITARLASECGRDVFAVPGSIHSPLAKGCHQLIRQGAKLVESVADVLEELDLPAPPGRPSTSAPPAAPDDEAASLLETLGYDPVHPDELSRRSGWTAGRLAAALLDLELSGRIARHPGGRVQRLVSGSPAPGG